MIQQSSSQKMSCHSKAHIPGLRKLIWRIACNRLWCVAYSAGCAIKLHVGDGIIAIREMTQLLYSRWYLRISPNKRLGTIINQ